jgi:hypothetical protein
VGKDSYCENIHNKLSVIGVLFEVDEYASNSTFFHRWMTGEEKKELQFNFLGDIINN